MQAAAQPARIWWSSPKRKENGKEKLHDSNQSAGTALAARSEDSKDFKNY
jgi:hypothetical protein